jgi:uncharacterized protein YceK
MEPKCRKVIHAAMTAVMCLSISGCGTVYSLSTAKHETICDECKVPRAFSGVMYDACIMKNSPVRQLVLLDMMMLSMLTDIVVLPYTLYAQMKYGNLRGGAPCVPEETAKDSKQKH